jgi:hypothetical protein
VKLENFRRLKLMMNKTMSGTDAERLTAIDMANRIVADEKTTWDRILDRVISVDVPIEAVAAKSAEGVDPAIRKAFVKKVNDAFEAIEESDPRGTFTDFIASLRDQWDARGRLSPAQLEALFAARDRAENGRRR